MFNESAKKTLSIEAKIVKESRSISGSHHF